jgi:hypothetical protein
MSSRAHKLIDEFFALPEEERAEVLQAISSVDEPTLEPEYIIELKRRVRSLNDGSAVLHDHEDVRREFLAALEP